MTKQQIIERKLELYRQSFVLLRKENELLKAELAIRVSGSSS